MRPILCGHRGAAGLVPENSLAAIDEAVWHGMDAVEIDVRCSADGVPVLMHDATSQRMVIGDHTIHKTDWQVLRTLKIRDGDDGHRPEETIPLLTEALARARDRLISVVEIKAPTPVTPVLEAIASVGVADQVIVMSFAYEIIREVEVLAPTIRTGYIAEDIAAAETLAAVRDLSIISCSHESLSATDIHAAQRAGLQVWAWTVNDPARMRELAEWGVDAIISDYPDRLNRCFCD